MVTDYIQLILYLYVFPITTVLLAVLHIFFLWWTPRPAKTLSRAKWKRGGSITAVWDDDQIVDLIYTHNMAGGLMEGKGSHEFYLFVPQLLDINEDMTAEEKKKILEGNAVVEGRGFLKGLNKPFYSAYLSKGVAMPTEMLTELAKSLEITGRTPEEVEEILKKAKIAKPVKPDVLTFFLRKSLGPQVTEPMKKMHEDIGRHGRPKPSLGRFALPIGVIFILIIFIWLLFGGQISSTMKGVLG